MDGEDVVELRANVEEYREQLQQLEELLLDEPDNEEYQSLYTEVQEAIQITEAAISTHAAAAAAAPSSAAAGGPADVPVTRKRKSRFEPLAVVAPADADAEATAAPPLPANSSLPQQVLDQIRSAKARSALEGRAPAAWAIGFPCLARYSTGHWVAAKVVGVMADGDFKVEWEGRDEPPELVHKSDCKPRDTGNYRGVCAPVRKAVTEVSKDQYERYLATGDAKAVEPPKWMQIRETDNAKQREKKSRALKAFKKKLRFEKKDLESTKNANQWKDFITGKGGKKKAGFMTGSKKQSMFSVPDTLDGKVGVIGSGRGMTNAPTKRSRLDF